MTDPNEPKKETVRIELPPQPAAKPPDPNTKSRETVRIQVPLRQSSDKPPVGAPAEPPPISKSAAPNVTSPQFFEPPPPPSPVPPPKPPAVSTPVLTPVTPAPGSPSSGPRKETARIPLMPDPRSKPLPTVQMKKTQPLIAMPLAAPQSAAIAVAPAEKSASPLGWVLLGVSVVILIIQIWTYVS